MCWNGHSGQKKVAEKDIEVESIDDKDAHVVDKSKFYPE